MDSPVVVAVNLAGTDVGAGLGRAHTLAVAHVVGGQVTRWSEHEVGWDVLHDQGPPGTHHARIVRFVRDHEVAVVVTGHIGPPMHHTLDKLGCAVVVGATGDARAAAAAATDAPPSTPPAAHRSCTG
ncbi:MAG: NifB/NifX family molybdenum-iron cluster-binding protein [Micrococcales bacterium]|nr:NifB/NifX family molybdenum-iron cluster-binding protein [Micrococcales bacterium]MCL2668575.1 NifB/NifX family molybdenum-iron cluster-binding protein [Micrococcales bacterium]